MSISSQPLLRREGGERIRRPAGSGPAGPTPRHGGSRTRGPARPGGRKVAPAHRAPWHEIGPGLLPYLPLSVLATLSVTVVPALAANWIVPLHGLPGNLVAVACAMALSLAIAAAEARIWRHIHGPRALVFGDLMLWAFVRRLSAERRLKRAGAAYRAAVGKDCSVRVELLEGLSHLLEIRNPVHVRPLPPRGTARRTDRPRDAPGPRRGGRDQNGRADPRRWQGLHADGDPAQGRSARR